MNARKVGTCLAVAALFSSGLVFAQAADPSAVATLLKLQGTVLVSQGDAMTAGGNGQPLRVGTRVVTTAGASVTIHYATGCDVTLAENQRFVVRPAGECAALIAAVEGTGVGGAGVGAGAGVGGGALAGLGGTTGLIVGGLLVAGGAAAIIVDHNRNNNVSPN